MQYVLIFATYMFAYFLLLPPKNVAGDAVYKGELEDRHLRPIRYFVYSSTYIFTNFCYFLSPRGLLVDELAFQIVCIIFIEVTAYFRLARHAEQRTTVSEHEHQAGGVTILSASELEHFERERLAEIVLSGRIDDILRLCAQNLEAGLIGRSFSIPRWLTRDEFKALQATMKDKQWLVEYTVMAQFTGKPRLVICKVNPPRGELREANRQSNENE